MSSEKPFSSDSVNVPGSTSWGLFSVICALGKGYSRSLKHGTEFSTWLFAYSALGLEIVPKGSLREYKMTHVSADRPEGMKKLRASRKGRVKGGITVSTAVHTNHGLGSIYMCRGLFSSGTWYAWVVWLETRFGGQMRQRIEVFAFTIVYRRYIVNGSMV